MFKKSIIVIGPPACGKSVQAEQIRLHFKLKKVVEFDDNLLPMFDTLILTNQIPDGIKAKLVNLKVVQFEDLVKQGVVKDLRQKKA